MGYDPFIHDLASVQAVRNNTYDVNVTDTRFDDYIFHNSTDEGMESVLRSMGVNIHRSRRQVQTIDGSSVVRATVYDSELNTSPPPSPPSDPSTAEIVGYSVGGTIGLIVISVILYASVRRPPKKITYSAWSDM